jgi:hypothetical protein
MVEEKKQTTVPYLSASRMGKVMELVSERSLQNPSVLYFKSYGFGDGDAFLAMNVLRFLKLVDEKDKPTERAKKFQLRGEARNKEVEAAIRESYRELFAVAEKPYELSKDDLANELMNSYSLSRRVSKSAVPAFLKLCEFAGLVEKGSVLTRKRQNGGAPKQQEKRIGKMKRAGELSIDDGEYVPVLFADGKMKLYLQTKILAKVILDTQLGEDLKKVTDSMSEFANKYYPTKLDKVDDNGSVE